MKIKVGDYDVLETGSVVGNLNESIDFELNTDLIHTLKLFFVDDDNKKEQGVLAKKSDTESKVIEMTFTNYNNSLGTGNIKPISLGNYNGRTLFFNFRIYSLEGGGKHIHYTWLLGKEENNG